MNYEKLKTQLKKGQINKVYLLYGEEQYLIDTIVKKIEHMVLGKDSNAMTKNEFADRVEISSVIDACHTMPMIGNKKMVIWKNSGLFHNHKKEEALLSLFEQISSDVCLLFIEEKINKKNIHFTTLQQKEVVYEISLRSNYDIVKYIVTQFNKKGKKITRDNANLFVEYAGAHLLDIEKDIEKISLFMDDKIEVRKQYIIDLCQGTKEAKLYELTNAVFEKDQNKAFKIVKELQADKVPVQMLLSVLHTSFMELYEVKLALEKKEKAVILRRGRPIHEYALKKLTESARKFELVKIRKIIKEIGDADMEIKSGHISAQATIELLIISMTTLN